MYLTDIFGRVYRSFYNYPSTEPSPLIPDELVLAIFSFLADPDLAMLGRISCVSRQWRRVADAEALGANLWKRAIFSKKCFRNAEWRHYFGKDKVPPEEDKEEFSSLPYLDFIQDIKERRRLFPKEYARDIMYIRMPKSLNGGLTLKSIGDLVKARFPGCDGTGYRRLYPLTVNAQVGNLINDQSYWVTMTTSILLGSENKSYDQQQELCIKQMPSGYRLPFALEAIVCAHTYYEMTKNRLFSNHQDMIYTRCQEKITYHDRITPLIVGAFTQHGLVLGINDEISLHIGCTAARAFLPVAVKTGNKPTKNV